MNTEDPISSKEQVSDEMSVTQKEDALLLDGLDSKQYYRGFFIKFIPIDEKGKGMLASSNCAIGNELKIDFEMDDKDTSDAKGKDSSIEDDEDLEARKKKAQKGLFAGVRGASMVVKGEMTEDELYLKSRKQRKAEEAEKAKKEASSLEKTGTSNVSDSSDSSSDSNEKSPKRGFFKRKTQDKDEPSKNTTEDEKVDDSDKDKPKGAMLLTKTDEIITRIDIKDSNNIKRFIDEGWTVSLTLTLVVYKNEGNYFWGEAMVICYKDSPLISHNTFPNYIKNIRKRITNGEHPSAVLSQKQFDKVIDSKGAWDLVQLAPFPKLNKGELIFKRKSSLPERLMKPAAEGNKGCMIASTLAWIIVAAVLIGIFIWPMFS